jgi:hypothetical protein
MMTLYEFMSKYCVDVRSRRGEDVEGWFAQIACCYSVSDLERRRMQRAGRRRELEMYALRTLFTQMRVKVGEALADLETVK